VLVVAVIHFRERRGETRTARPVHGHTQLEVVWTLIPFVIVCVFTGLSWKVLRDNDKAPNAMAVTVWGQQFTWTYDYPQAGIVNSSELVLPVGQPVRLTIQSKDVIHGWWVPDFRVQMNATPGQKNLLTVTPNKTGSFKVVCTFICGDGHPIMGTNVKGSLPRRVRVLSVAEFQAWLGKGKAEAAKQAAAEAASPAGKAIGVFTRAGCGGCHTWGPAKSAGKVGPDLDALAADAKKAGKPAADYVKESIVSPGAYIVPGYTDQMPKNYGTTLSPADLDALVKALSAGGK
jgi:cytochrome c oxidase subunit 2